MPAAAGRRATRPRRNYAAKGFTAAKMRVVGRDGFSIVNCVRRVKAARRGLVPDVELTAPPSFCFTHDSMS
jgi:L-alanine-DL-glutamate epimerase-like enolase superfamily enzyme